MTKKRAISWWMDHGYLVFAVRYGIVTRGLQVTGWKKWWQGKASLMAGLSEELPNIPNISQINLTLITILCSARYLIYRIEHVKQVRKCHHFYNLLFLWLHTGQLINETFHRSFCMTVWRRLFKTELHHLPESGTCIMQIAAVNLQNEVLYLNFDRKSCLLWQKLLL